VSSLKSFKLSQLAETLGAELEGDPTKEIFGIGPLVSSTSDEISFISKESYRPNLELTKAGAVICNSETSKFFEGNKLICSNPYLLYAKCTQLFKEKPVIEKGISTLASIEDSAVISETASISNFVSISKNVVIEDDVVIMPGVTIGEGCKIGKRTILYANASLYDSVSIGIDCIIHSGTVIGSDGLGFAKENNKWVKIEHLGKVIIGNDVEIGSNTTIDRGSIGDTVIGNNVKIDNQVHIAHNVSIGSGTAIAGNSAIAGSTQIGKNCTLAGCSAIVDNIKIADEVHITAMSLITKSIKESGFYSSGTPFMKNSDWKKNAVSFKKLHKLIKK
jgi:UDP-3-O-[3-hydroxymyristoyl] glucosamine N-acyltransferase